MVAAHRFNGQCNIGHSLAKDLVTCEKCKAIVGSHGGLSVKSRNKNALLEAHGMKFLPYTVEDWKLILSGQWNNNIYPWDRKQNA